MIPALVLGEDLTALGALRCLGRTGVPSLCTAQPGDMAAISRWYRPWNAPLAAATLARDLLASPVQSAVLVPCSDQFTVAVARLPDDLRARFPASVAPASAIASLEDKGRLTLLLKELGLPHPPTWPIQSVADLDAVPESVWEHAFLKPRHSQSFFEAYKVKGLFVASRAAAAEQVGLLNARGMEMMLQEYVPGPTTNHVFIDGFIDRHGRVAGIMARRRLRMWPPDFGNSSYHKTIALAEVADAASTVRRLLAEVGYRGAFSAELKCDARDGQHKLLEVNARPWWYIEFAQRCGLNVARMMYDDALGRDVVPVTKYEVNRRMVFLYYDYQACLALRRRGELSLGQWIGSWIGADLPLLAWDDLRVRLVATWRWLVPFVKHRLMPRR